MSPTLKPSLSSSAFSEDEKYSSPESIPYLDCDEENLSLSIELEEDEETWGRDHELEELDTSVNLCP